MKLKKKRNKDFIAQFKKCLLTNSLRDQLFCVEFAGLYSLISQIEKKIFFSETMISFVPLGQGRKASGQALIGDKV